MVVELNLRLEGHFTDWAVVFSVDQGQSGVTLHVDARLGWKHGGGADRNGEEQIKNNYSKK